VVNDTLPPSLTRFGSELERAITRQLTTPEPTPPRRHRPSRRRRVLIGAGVGCVVAGGAAAAVVATSGGSSGSAWTQHVLRAAEIALPKPAPNTILHVSVTQTMTPAARRGTISSAVPSVNADGWFQQGGQWRQVTRETVPGDAPVWQSDTAVYDPAAHQLYLDPPLPNGHPRYTLVKTGTGGSYTLRIATAHGTVRQTVSSAEAHALRTGDDVISWSETWNGHTAALQPGVGPSARSLDKIQAQQPDGVSLSFPAQLHQALQSGRAQVAGRVTIDGRTAIKIEIVGEDHKRWLTYYVDPATYAPIELDTYGFGSSDDVTRLVFHTYQQLPLKGHASLLRLHPTTGTSIDHSATGYFEHLPAPLFW
jgi:hypothetical protein